MKFRVPTLLAATTACTSLFAGSVTFKPGTTALQSLDHANLYTWGMDWSLPSHLQVTGATLRINGLYDWTAPDPGNILRIHLLDSATPTVMLQTTTTNTVTSVYRQTKTEYKNSSGNVVYSSTSGKTYLSNPPPASVTTETEISKPGPFSSGVNSLGVGGTVVSYVDDPSFTIDVDNFTSGGVTKNLSSPSPTTANTSTVVSSTSTPSMYGLTKVVTVREYTTTKTEISKKEVYTWDSVTPLTSYSDNDGPATKVNLVYSFSSTQLDALQAYLTNGNDFALGFDPDCHFYDKGVSLEVYYANVPDASSSALLLALSLGGLAVARRRRLLRR